MPSLQWVWGAKLLLPSYLIFVLWLLSIRVISQPRTVPLEDSSSSLVRAAGLSLPMAPVVGLSFCPVELELPSFYPVVQQEELPFLEELLVVVSWRLVQEVGLSFCRAALEVPSSSLTLVAAPGVPSLRLLVSLVVVPVLSFSHREERAVW